MSDNYGLTTTGFNIKPYTEVITEMDSRAISLYGNDVNLNSNSPLGLFIQLISYFIATGDSTAPGLWELAQAVYNAGYVDTAEGISLDHAVKYAAMVRKQAYGAITPVVVNGVNGTPVPVGFLCGTQGGIQFATTQAATISNGTATVNVQAVVGGSNTNVPANTINVITNPTAGITSVNNPSAAIGGYDAETDDQLRTRYFNTAANPGASSTNSIRASLLTVSGVVNALVPENTTSATVGNLPPKCIAPIVEGGADLDVANMILNVKAGGIQSYGTTVVTVNDLSGNPQQIGFTRPTTVGVWCNAVVTTNSNFPSNGMQLVQTAIIKYIGGTDANGNVYPGVGLGGNVIYNQCVNAALSVSGVVDVAISLSTDGVNYNTSNVVVSSLQVANTNSNQVVVT